MCPFVHSRLSDVVCLAISFVVSVLSPVSLVPFVALHSRAHCRCVVLANEIGDEGAKAIALALEKNSALTNLDLGGNATIILERVAAN